MATIQEWPWSRSLGERWVVFPSPVPSDQPWPGIKFFSTEEEARAHG